jgi:predicted Ser/Thr protein kinase
VVHHQADAKQLHRHVERREYLPSRIFVVKVGLNLRYLDEEQLLVVGI